MSSPAGTAGGPPAAPGAVVVPREVTSVAAARAADSERRCRLHPDVVEALAAADLFRLCVPSAIGGREATAAEALGVIETVAGADGAAGWCLMIAATSGLLGGWLAPDAGRRVFGDPAGPCGAIFAPKGRAAPAAGGGGWTVDGRWAFASGITHSGWMFGGCLLEGADGPRRLRGGTPDVHLAAIPRHALTVDETWSVTGLRGTGSHDMVAVNVSVADELLVPLLSGAPLAPGALYRFPVFGLLSGGIAAVALGIARAALADFSALAVEKTPSMSRRLLAEHPAAQTSAARAWASLRAARSLLREAVEEAWSEAEGDAGVSLGRRAALRLAATHATEAATAVVADLHRAAGGSAIYASSPLERRFRDVHTLRSHMMVSPSSLELTGRVLLGVDADTTML